MASKTEVVEVTPEDEEFIIESILDHRLIRSQLQYYIKWKGYPHSDNTWQKEEDVAASSMKAIEQYWERQPDSALKRIHAPRPKEKKAPLKTPKQPLVKEERAQPASVADKARALYPDLKRIDDERRDGSKTSPRKRQERRSPSASPHPTLERDLFVRMRRPTKKPRMKALELTSSRSSTSAEPSPIDSALDKSAAPLLAETERKDMSPKKSMGGTAPPSTEKKEQSPRKSIDGTERREDTLEKKQASSPTPATSIPPSTRSSSPKGSTSPERRAGKSLFTKSSSPTRPLHHGDPSPSRLLRSSPPHHRLLHHRKHSPSPERDLSPEREGNGARSETPKKALSPMAPSSTASDSRQLSSPLRQQVIQARHSSSPSTREEDIWQVDTMWGIGATGADWLRDVQDVYTVEKNEHDQLFVYARLTSGKMIVRPAFEANEYIPHKMLAFYERHIRFQRQPSSASKPQG